MLRWFDLVGVLRWCCCTVRCFVLCVGCVGGVAFVVLCCVLVCVLFCVLFVLLCCVVLCCLWCGVCFVCLFSLMFVSGRVRFLSFAFLSYRHVSSGSVALLVSFSCVSFFVVSDLCRYVRFCLFCFVWGALSCCVWCVLL